MMKISDCVFGPLTMLLLFFFFTDVNAVLCPYGIKKYGIDMKQCSACVAYACDSILNKNDLIMGCPEDYFIKCAGFSKAADFIKDNNPLKACYTDGTTLYISGCEDEVDGASCITNYTYECKEMIEKGRRRDGYGTYDHPFYTGSNEGWQLLRWIFAQFY